MCVEFFLPTWDSERIATSNDQSSVEEETTLACKTTRRPTLDTFQCQQMFSIFTGIHYLQKKTQFVYYLTSLIRFFPT